MEIYEDTYEKLAFVVKQKQEEGTKQPGKHLLDDDDALDMFGDKFDEKHKEASAGSDYSEISVGRFGKVHRDAQR